MKGLNTGAFLKTGKPGISLHVQWHTASLQQFSYESRLQAGWVLGMILVAVCICFLSFIYLFILVEPVQLYWGREKALRLAFTYRKPLKKKKSHKVAQVSRPKIQSKYLSVRYLKCFCLIRVAGGLEPNPAHDGRKAETHSNSPPIKYRAPK